MEHIVLSSMSKYFSNNDIIIPHQNGFRKGFSTLKELCHGSPVHFVKFCQLLALNRYEFKISKEITCK